MNVHFVDSLPGSGQGSYIDFYNRDYNQPGWSKIDIGKILSLRQEEFFFSIEKWHTELCVRGARSFKWWWLLPASRLILWHPPIFKPLIFAMAVAEELAGSTCQEIYLVGCPAEVGEYLREFSPAQNVHARRKYRHAFLKKLRCVLGSFKAIFEVLVCVLSRRLKKLDIEGSSSIIVWTYGLNSGGEQIYGKDHFFGDMFDPDVFKHPVHWVYYDSPRKALETGSPFYAGGGRSLIYDWIGLSEWWSLTKFCLTQMLSFGVSIDMPEFALNGFVSKRFAKNFASVLGDGFIPHAEYAAFLGMRRILEQKKPGALVYPYEEKCLERALLMAVKECMSNTETIGFAHAVYTKGHMYVRRRSEAMANPPMPNKLMVTGPALKKWFIDWAGWNKNRLFVAGSPRHHNMSTLESSGLFGDRPLRILVLISRGYEATALANQLQTAPHVFDNCEITIRPYPYAFQEEQNSAYSKIMGICKHINISGGSLAAQLAWCDVAVFCSTTAGLEAMLSGRLTVYLDLNHIFPLDAVGEKFDDAKLPRCKDLSDLHYFLERVHHMTKDDYYEMAVIQNKLAGEILQEVDHAWINRFFQVYG